MKRHCNTPERDITVNVMKFGIAKTKNARKKLA
jgi:hypothetical protein